MPIAVKNGPHFILSFSYFLRSTEYVEIGGNPTGTSCERDGLSILCTTHSTRPVRRQQIETMQIADGFDSGATSVSRQPQTILITEWTHTHTLRQQKKGRMGKMKYDESYQYKYANAHAFK